MVVFNVSVFAVTAGAGGIWLTPATAMSWDSRGSLAKRTRCCPVLVLIRTTPSPPPSPVSSADTRFVPSSKAMPLLAKCPLRWPPLVTTV